MNKYIIIILILILIIYFLNINKIKDNFRNGVINYLYNNNLDMRSINNINIRNKQGQNLPITINNKKINIGDSIIFDSSNNNINCGKYNIDDNNNFVDQNNLFKIDLSNNIYIDDKFVYKYDNTLTNTNNTLEIDPSNNIVFDDYKYTIDGKFINEKKYIIIDPSGTLTLDKHNIDTYGNYFNTVDNVNVYNNGDLSCNKYKKINNVDKLYLDDSNVSIDIDSNGEIISDDPYIKVFKIGKYYNNQTNSQILAIVSIKFFDLSDNVIPYDDYITTTNGIDICGNGIAIVDLTSKFLFTNRDSTTKIKILGLGYRESVANYYQNIESNPLLLGKPIYDITNGYSQEYIFTFYNPTLIKRVEIEFHPNDWTFISKSYLMAFNKFNTKIKSIQIPIFQVSSTNLKINPSTSVWTYIL